MKNNPKIFFWLLFTNLFLAMCLIGREGYARWQKETAWRKEVVRTGAILDERQIIPKDDFLRLSLIRRGAGSGISDADLDWCLGLMAPNGSSTPASAAIRASDVESAITTARHRLTSEQKERIFHTVVENVIPYEDTPSPHGLNKDASIRILVALKDQRAVPYLEKLLQDPRQDIREKAKWGIAILSKYAQRV